MLVIKQRRDGWVILYRNRVLCGLYGTKREALDDARGLKRSVKADAQLKKDLDAWANLENPDDESEQASGSDALQGSADPARRVQRPKRNAVRPR